MTNDTLVSSTKGFSQDNIVLHSDINDNITCNGKIHDCIVYFKMYAD